MYGGYTYNSKDKLELSVSIDYTVFDMNKFINNNAAMKDYVNKSNKLTIDGIIKMFEASGSTCSKK